MALWKRLARWPFGEASLWVLFAFSFAAAAADSYGNEPAVMLSAIAALAAVGVRATREPRGSKSD